VEVLAESAAGEGEAGAGVGGGEAGAAVPRIRVTIEVENFEEMTTEDVIVGVIEAVELRQADGLLVTEKHIRAVEGVSRVAAYELGVEEPGPVMRLYTAQKEENDG
jgi:hypothetical protein